MRRYSPVGFGGGGGTRAHPQAASPEKKRGGGRVARLCAPVVRARTPPTTHVIGAEVHALCVRAPPPV